MQRLTSRLAGAVVAAALIVVGAMLAARPVSDEHARATATDTVSGHITSVRATWDGSQVLTVTWAGPNGQVFHAELEDYGASPPWTPGYHVRVYFDPSRPASDAVLASPNWTFAMDFRADAVFQAMVPFTLALIVLALAVIWPADPWLFGTKARRARRSLQQYTLTPAVTCALVVAGAVIYQDQRLSAYSMGADRIVGWLSVVLMLLLIWPSVRAVQYYRLRQLLTVPDDSVGSMAITSIAGRHLHIGAVQFAALAGQRPSRFQAGDRVRLYGRWERHGPALITDGEQILIGFGKRPAVVAQYGITPSAVTDQPEAPVDVIAEPLSHMYPQLARKPNRYLMTAVVLLVIVVSASIAIVAVAGKVALGPLWTAWIMSAILMIVPVGRYIQLSRLLQSPHVARQGVATSVNRSGRRARVTIEVPGEWTRRFRGIAGARLTWLSVGQEVVLREAVLRESQRRSAESVAVLTTADGHVALAIAKVVQVQDAAAVGSAS